MKKYVMFLLPVLLIGLLVCGMVKEQDKKQPDTNTGKFIRGMQPVNAVKKTTTASLLGTTFPGIIYIEM